MMMTREETQGILMSIQAAYQNYRAPDKTIAVNTWYKMLSEYTYNQVSAGLKAYILSDTSGFAPSIGQIIDKIHSMSGQEEFSEMEAWALVSKAIRNSGYNSQEEFEKLPPLVQKAVGYPSQLRTWALDEDYNEGVVSSNFIKCYRTIAQREKEMQKIPEEIRKAIGMSNRNPYSVQIEGKRVESIGDRANKNQGRIAAVQSIGEVVPMPKGYKERLQRILTGGPEEILLP